MSQQPRIFRVFVSSPFTDLKAERNALQRHVWPALRELCARYGTRFQAIDLRWGISEEAGRDQRTLPICLEELRRCQEVSPRPNFVVLLGDRYGWRPLPVTVPADEFESLLNGVPWDERVHLVGSEEERAPGWYRRDDNAIPVHYILRPRTGDLEDSSHWSQVEHDLLEILSRAAAAAGLPAAASLKYGASATEQEIQIGALAAHAPLDHVFAFFRTIHGLGADETARDFIDLLPGSLGIPCQIDTANQMRLVALKHKIRSRLPEGNVRDYSAAWTGGGVSGDHLSQLCVDVFTALAGVILDEIAKLRHEDPMEREIAAHMRFGFERARVVAGRHEPLSAIAAYIASDNRQPLLVHGPSGCGKSAVMARAAHDIAAAKPKALVIRRYIGATPDSSDSRSLLAGICRQIAVASGDTEAAIPLDLVSLVQQLSKQLAAVTPDRPIVLILDALDQLTDTDNVGALRWLPSRLPPHVRVVVSTTSEHDRPAGMHDFAHAPRFAPANRLELGALGREDGAWALDVWMSEVGRTLQPDQRTTVLDAFSASGLALHLRLLFEEARSWHSFDDAMPQSETVTDSIARLLSRLSSPAQHGHLLVERAMAYLVAAKNGLAEDEIVDVLSADPEVYGFYAASAQHDLPERRLPDVVWSRLAFDLRPYMTERTADGATLLGFFHPQIREAVGLAFCSGSQAITRHRALADYFVRQGLDNGVESAWSADSPTDVRIAETVRTLARNKALPEAETTTSNLRKLSEQPFQQTRGKQWQALVKTLTDFAFLEQKAATGNTVGGARGIAVYDGIYKLGDDFRQALDKGPFEGSAVLAALHEALRSNAHVFEREPSSLGAQIHNIFALADGNAAVNDVITSRSRELLDARTWLRLRSCSARQGHRALLRVLTHGNPVNGLAWTDDRVVSTDASGTVRIWRADTGTLAAEHYLGVKDAFAVALSPDGERLVVGTDRGIAVVRNLTDPTSRPVFIQEDSTIMSLDWSPGGDRLAFGAPGKVAAVSMNGVSFGKIIGATSDLTFQPPLRVKWSPDGALLAGASAYGWRLWRAYDLKEVHSGRHRSSVSAIAWSPSGDAIAVAFAFERKGRTHRGRLYGVIDVMTTRGDLIKRIDPGSGPVRELAWARSQESLAISFNNERTLDIYGFSSGLGLDYLVSTMKEHAGPIALENLVTIWNPYSGALSGVLTGHQGPVSSLRWSADGERIVSASDDGTVRMWHAGSAEHVGDSAFRLGHWDRITGAAVCPGGCTFATASNDTTIRFWDFEGDQAMIAEKGDFGIHALAWSPDSHYDLKIRTVGRRVGTLARSDEGYFRSSVRLRNLTTGVLVRLPGSSVDARCLAWSPQAELIAAGGRKVLIWDARSRRRMLRVNTQSTATALAWNDDGQWLVWAEADGRLRAVEVPRGRVGANLRTHGPSATALSWISGSLWAVGHGDGSVALWDMKEGTMRWVSRHGAGTVQCLASFGEPPFLVAGLSDSSLRLFNFVSGDCEAVVFLPSPSLCLRRRRHMIDVVDDGSTRSAIPAAYTFTLERRDQTRSA